MKRSLLIFIFSNIVIASAQWIPQSSGTTSHLEHVFFLNSDTGFVNQQGGIRKTINGGGNWTYVNGGGINIYDFHFYSIDTGVCISQYGIYRTTNGGIQWDAVWVDSSLSWFTNLFCLNNDTLFTTAVSNVTDSMIFFKSIDHGLSWNRKAFFDFSLENYVFFTSLNTGYISSGGFVFKTLDGGMSWQNVYTDISAFFMSNYFLTDSIGFLLAVSGEILKTTDGGFVWLPQNTNGNNDAKRSMQFVNSNIGYAVGGNGLSPGFVLKTIDGGSNWTLDYASSETLIDVYLPSPNVGYACGEGGTILKYVGDVGMADENRQASLMAYPNPTSNKFTLQTTSRSSNSTITILNSIGNIILKSEIRSPKIEIDLSSHPAGIYFVKVIEGDRMAVKKIVKMCE